MLSIKPNPAQQLQQTSQNILNRTPIHVDAEVDGDQDFDV